MAAKSSAISSLVSAAEKVLFLGAAAGAGAGGDASCGGCAPPADAGAFPAASDLDASGATVAERRVRRFHGRGGCDAAAAPGDEACGCFSLSGDGVCGCGGGDAGPPPSLEQRRRRCAPQLSVGKAKSWRRVRLAGAGDGVGVGDADADAAAGEAGLAVALWWWWWSEAPAMRTMGRGEERRKERERRVQAPGRERRRERDREEEKGGEVFKKAEREREEPRREPLLLCCVHRAPGRLLPPPPPGRRGASDHRWMDGCSGWRRAVGRFLVLRPVAWLAGGVAACVTATASPAVPRIKSATRAPAPPGRSVCLALAAAPAVRSGFPS